MSVKQAMAEYKKRLKEDPGLAEETRLEKKMIEEDEARFEALYADKYGIVDEKYYKMEMKTGKKYSITWHSGGSKHCNNFVELEKLFYSDNRDCLCIKLDGFQKYEMVFCRLNGKETTAFD